MELLARKSRLTSTPVELPPAPDALQQSNSAIHAKWIQFLATRLQIESEEVETTYADLEAMLDACAPALLRVRPGNGNSTPGYLLVLRSGRGRMRLLCQNRRTRVVPREQVRLALCGHLEDAVAEPINKLFERAAIENERREHAQRAIMREQLGAIPIEGCWLLRLSPASNFLGQMRRQKLHWRLGTFFLAHILALSLFFFSWWIIGQGALQGYFERSWLTAWALLLVSIIPFQLLELWSQSQLSTGSGLLLKLRLIFGTLQLDPESIRSQGAGQFLSRVMESEAFEQLLLQGGFSALVAIFELLSAVVILAHGAGGLVHGLILVVWMLIIFLFCWNYYRKSRSWVASYREMTNGIVEQMVGNRTRLAQREPDKWHEEEDRQLHRYLTLSEQLDRAGISLQAFSSRGWLLLGLAGMAYAFVFTPQDNTALAISLGGVLLASQSLSTFVMGVLSIVQVRIAWEQISPMFRVKAEELNSEAASFSLTFSSEQQDASGNGSPDPLLLSRDLIFRYRDYGHPVLNGCDLKIFDRDRVLLEGPSGGGKTTLASLVAGLRKPLSGLHLLRGFDMQTLGTETWRSRVVSAPQFHENHVFTETFSFNLLMGRCWPPRDEDLEEAETICRELGLGELLERMPAGFQQIVGESGWQLSHGERSRLYIARALLQHTDLIILDESFAALDPANMRLALECVFKRAPALLVIAHP